MIDRRIEMKPYDGVQEARLPVSSALFEVSIVRGGEGALHMPYNEGSAVIETTYYALHKEMLQFH